MSRSQREEHSQNSSNNFIATSTRLDYDWENMTEEDRKLAKAHPINTNRKAQQMTAGQYEELVIDPVTGHGQLITRTDLKLREMQLNTGLIDKVDTFTTNKRKVLMHVDNQALVTTAHTEVLKQLREKEKARNRKALGNEEPGSQPGSSSDGQWRQGYSSSSSSSQQTNSAARDYSGYYNQRRSNSSSGRPSSQTRYNNQKRRW